MDKPLKKPRRKFLSIPNKPMIEVKLQIIEDDSNGLKVLALSYLKDGCWHSQLELLNPVYTFSGDIITLWDFSLHREMTALEAKRKALEDELNK